jgi:hypothetical protein
MPGTFIGVSIFNRLMTRSWTPQTLVVENAAPTNIVMTGLTANTNLVASDFTIIGITATVSSISRDVTNKIITAVLNISVAEGDVLNVVLKGKSYAVTNNVSWAALAPTSLVATVISDTEIDLSWTNNDTTGNGVSVERGTNGITFAEITTVALGVASYNNTGLTGNTTYYYRVRAFKN